MSKLIKASIDVTKIKKEHIFEGQKGKYINIDIWINDEEDKFGNICSIAQTFKNGDKFDKVYLGNGKELEKKQEPATNQPEQIVQPENDLPF